MINLNEVLASIGGVVYLLLVIGAVVLLPPNTEFRQSIYDLEVTVKQDAPQVLARLNEQQVVHNQLSFRIAAWLMGYQKSQTEPGLYQIKNGWSNWRVLKHLKSKPPQSTPVFIKSYQMRGNTLKGICKNLDIKHTALKELLQDQTYLDSWGPFTPENIYCIFFSDTLLMYKNSRTKEVADRLMRNYLDFWTPDKLEQAASLGLTAPEVGILASIVYAETKIPEEMPKIAGLYLNRLNKKMRLQADPTVVFAIGRPLTRVLKAHKRIRSDYNTYRVSGLPPGPVFTPTQKVIEAVLSAETHDFLFFCARYDFSGYHLFSRTFEEHQRAATKYQSELNKRRIGFRVP